FRFGDEHDILERAEQRRQERTRRPFVGGDDHAKTRVHEAPRVGLAPAPGVAARGILISPVVPDPGPVVMASVAEEPYWRIRRRSTFRRPPPSPRPFCSACAVAPAPVSITVRTSVPGFVASMAASTVTSPPCRRG